MRNPGAVAGRGRGVAQAFVEPDQALEGRHGPGVLRSAPAQKPFVPLDQQRLGFVRLVARCETGAEPAPGVRDAPVPRGQRLLQDRQAPAEQLLGLVSLARREADGAAQTRTVPSTPLSRPVTVARPGWSGW